MSEMYDSIAGSYDMLNADINYADWADFIVRCFDLLGVPEHGLVADLACGTGSMTLRLAERGYDMTGIDISESMLTVARERAVEQGRTDILWLCQDMAELDLFGTMDAMVCCLDGINHVTNPQRLEKAFSLVHNFLNPDGAFIFDVNSEYKFREVYGSNAYILEDEGIVCAWQNCFDPSSRVCDFLLSVFEEEEDGRYKRRDEEISERMYTRSEITDMLTRTGFEVRGIFGSYDMTEPYETDERLYVLAVAKK